jgi:hypothetical protein
MTRDPFERRRQFRILWGVLAVGIGMSLLVAGALVYKG